MTTTPHVLTGTALASLLPTSSAYMKLVGFGFGFASHYVLDAIPHWERLYGPHYNDELPLGRTVVGRYTLLPRV